MLFLLCLLSLNEIIITAFRELLHIAVDVMIDTLLMETEQFLVSRPNSLCIQVGLIIL